MGDQICRRRRIRKKVVTIKVRNKKRRRRNKAKEEILWVTKRYSGQYMYLAQRFKQIHIHIGKQKTFHLSERQNEQMRGNKNIYVKDLCQKTAH